MGLAKFTDSFFTSLGEWKNTVSRIHCRFIAPWFHARMKSAAVLPNQDAEREQSREPLCSTRSEVACA